MLSIGVIGAGSWGTAVSCLLATSGYSVTLWARDKELVKEIQATRENRVYLKGVKLPDSVFVTNNIQSALKNDIVAIAVPVPFLRGVVGGLSVKGNYVISLSKGMEIDTFLTPSEIIKDAMEVDENRIAVLSGPNFALEVAKRLPTATVIASSNIDVAVFLQNIFAAPYFRVYASDDVKGVEICGAMKNVMAIASGISDGLKLGFNARASLLTRGLAEMFRFGSRFDAKPDTFMGLAGIGDLILTATGELSRNRYVGLKLAEGKGIDEILRDMKMVPEGVTTTKAIYEYAKTHGMDLPITEQVYHIIYEGKNPLDALRSLMKRPLKRESYLL